MGALWADLRDAGLLAKTELLAMRRRILRNRRQLAGTAIGLLQFAVVIPLFVLEPALSFGRALAGGNPPLGTLGGALTWALVGGLFTGAVSSVNQDRIGNVGALVRTSMAPRAVAAGRLGSELLQTVALFGPAGVVVLVIVAAGAGTPLVGVLLAVAVGLPLLAGLLIGRTVGAAARYAGVLARLSTPAKAVTFLIGMGGIFLGSQLVIQAFLPEDASFGPAVTLPALLPGRPMQGLAGVVLMPYGTAPGPVGVFAMAIVAVGVPLGLLGAIRTEAALLITDIDDAGVDNVSGSRGVPPGVDRWPALRMGWRHLLRVARDPKAMAHLFPLVFGGFASVGFVVTDPAFALAAGAPAAVVLGVVLAGAAFCLNPMGDDRDQLPLLLTSVDSTGILLRGRAMAGAALGLLLAVGAGTPLALLGHPLTYAVGQTLIAPLLVGASATIALGLGSLVPKFERREYMNVQRAHPSQWALLGFLFGGVVVAGVGLGLTWAVTTGRLTATVGAAGLGVYGAVLTLGGYLGYRYAVRRFDALTLDSV